MRGIAKLYLLELDRTVVLSNGRELSGPVKLLSTETAHSSGPLQRGDAVFSARSLAWTHRLGAV